MAGLFAIHFSYHFLDSLTFDSINVLLHISNFVNVPKCYVFCTELRHVIDRFFRDCKIIRDPQTLKSKGYGFVSYVNKVVSFIFKACILPPPLHKIEKIKNLKKINHLKQLVNGQEEGIKAAILKLPSESLAIMKGLSLWLILS